MPRPRPAGKGPRPANRPVAKPSVPPPAAAAAQGGQTAPVPIQVGAGRELLYGRHAVLEALRAARRRVRRVWLAEGIAQGSIIADIAAAAQARGALVTETTRAALEQAIPGNHQGVAAEVEPYPYLELDALLDSGAAPPGTLPPDALFLVLDHLQDVQNLGTLLRTAEAMAVTGVILPGRRAAEITPAAANASAGAVEHLRIAVVSNLVQALEQLKEAGVWVAGLDAGPGAVPIGRADLTGRLAVVVGAEGEGLAKLVRQRCDWLLEIPMYGKIGSLNAAVAGSIALVAVRQAQKSAASEEPEAS